MESINKLVLGFVTLIIGIVLISQVASTGQEKTTLSSVTSEVQNIAATTGRNDTWINASKVYTITKAPTSWKTTDCPITNFVLKNSSGAAFTLTTDYTFTASTGKFSLVDSATALATLPVANNNTYASYSYCPDEYMNLSWGRTIINLVPGFFGIAILLVSVAIFYSVARDAGLFK